jgi:hypothetical protein
MNRTWKTLRPSRLLLIASLALLWGLSYAPKTQRLAAQSVLLNPPAVCIGWANGALVAARTGSIPRREQVFPIKWARCGFGYEHFDLERARSPYTPGAVTFQAYDFAVVYLPFWFFIVLLLFPSVVAALYRAVRARFSRSHQSGVAGSGGAV